MVPIRKVAVVGTGGIGGSWAAYFLAQGLDVVATDVKESAEQDLRARIDLYWDSLSAAGLAPKASVDKLRFVPTLEEALRDAEFIQESGPESLAFKRSLFARMSEVARPDALLVSSSSTLLVSDFQRDARNPERVVLGHPFNPPHLVPLVEVVGGQLTAEGAISDVVNFYQSIGKSPIRLKREIFGHIANRLQTALWREAFHLISTGVASAEDIDIVITDGPGLRWAVTGPCAVLHVSGGRGGVRSTLAHMGKPTNEMAEALYQGSITAEMFDAMIASIEKMMQSKDIDDLTRYRDFSLLAVIQAKKAAQAKLQSFGVRVSQSNVG